MSSASSNFAVIYPNPNVPYDIVFADTDLLVVDKPAGVVTQPGLGHSRDSLLNGLFSKYGPQLKNLGIRRDWGLLHRLDRSTSGLLLVGLKPTAYDALRDDFTHRRVEKEYLAIVHGRPIPAQGVVQARLKEIHTGIKKTIISKSGQEAISAYRMLCFSDRAALVAVIIKTGRLHQIRAHMMFLGTPVLGDDIYTSDNTKPRADKPDVRIYLHSWRMGFKHPVAQRWCEFTRAPGPDFLAAARSMGLSVPELLAKHQA
jgi:23S rRNA pseudouridine1911/1915/1917 synthase